MRSDTHEEGRLGPNYKALLYLPRKVGGRGLNSVEDEYNLTKIKTAVNLYQNQDPTMKVVREFEERATHLGTIH